ncbi:MAG: hypothetical protein ACP5G3_05035, partial [Sulfurihydrogenibium sp.]|uniref:hypothetical protein n=1 Tax=Sulfurihydrogenibium sp. TaxID=2053621 RepID=UPI003D099AA4
MIKIFLPLVAFTFALMYQSNSQEEEVYRTDPVYIQTYEESNQQKQNENAVVYKVYAMGLSVADMYITNKDGKIEARGRTYKSLRWLYDYDFLYIEQDDYKALYEKENNKEKIYENQEIYEKKPWLPIIAQFFKGKVSPEEILSMNISINDAPVYISKEERDDYTVYIFKPQNSKTKKIEVYLKS